MMFLLNNWKAILSVFGTIALCYGLHALDVNRIEARQRDDLTAQATTLNKECLAEKAITEGVSNDYQKKLGLLKSRYNSLVGMQQNRCVAVSASKPAAGRDATAPVAELPRSDVSVTSDALYYYARDAEQVRLQLQECQSFIQKTWALVGQ